MIATATNWHSWHLHASTLDPAELDLLLTKAVGPLMDDLASGGQAPPWFFIRYWLHGPHLRVRVADLDGPQADAACARLQALADRARATAAPGRPAEQAGYLDRVAVIAAAGEAGAPVDPGDLLPAGVYPQRYEPEYERYGGRALMPLTERLFHISSLTALAACQGRRGNDARALGLQALAVSCGVLGADTCRFLTVLRDHWTNWLSAGQPGINAAAIESAARRAAARIAPARPALLGATRGCYPESWAPWALAASTALRTWQRELGPRAARGVFGSHVHMMQNRLGIGAGGEAYLAATLLHVIAEPDRARS